MVSSVGSTPYSYLDQLTGKKTALAVPGAVSSTGKNTSAADAETGLSQEVMALLKNVGKASSTTSLLGISTSLVANNPFASLFGYSTENSSKNKQTIAQKEAFNIMSSSGIYQAALAGAATKKLSASTNTDFMTKVINSYQAYYKPTTGKAVNVTG